MAGRYSTPIPNPPTVFTPPPETWGGGGERQVETLRGRAIFNTGPVHCGEVPFGIVYVTDAAASDRVRLVGVFPAETHQPITYWAGVVAGRERPSVIAYFHHLGSDSAIAVFRRHGFQVD